MKMIVACSRVFFSAKKQRLLKNYKLLLFSLFIIMSCTAFGQGNSKITITGTVLDSSGALIERANIVVDGKKGVGTSTDVNGKFVLDVEPGSVLTISYVGYQSKTVTVTASAKVLNVVLAQTIAKPEDEVIVTAYGRKQRKEAVVGSVTSIKPGELKIPASNLTNALAGQIAGIISYQRSGQPGSDNSDFFIRGVTTFGYSKSPLILIDNVEMSSSDLARLQVDDIASFSILKDASATALYGARGANGVILVSTKEGKAGKMKMNVRLESAISKPTKVLKTADPITYMNQFNEAITTRNPLQELKFDQNKIYNTQLVMNNAAGSNKYVYPAVDWLDMLFKKQAATERANLSLSGGGDVARYYVAGSYNVDNGIFKKNVANNNDNNVKFQNYQLRSNVNLNLTKTTELIVRLSGNFNEYNGPIVSTNDLYTYAMHASPVLFPAYYEPDSANLQVKHILFGNSLDQAMTGVGYTNPYAQLLRGHRNYSESRMSAQLELNQKLDFITKGLNFKVVFNTNRYSYFSSGMQYGPYYYYVDVANGGYDRTNNTYALKWINSQPGQAQEYLDFYNWGTNANTYVYFQGNLDYSKKIGEHNFSATLIGTGQQTRYSSAGDLNHYLPYRNLGLAGRATYSYKNKYFTEFNFGYNGSERFSEKHRFAFFPSIGAGWVFSEEKFLESLQSVVTRGKLRASYGLAGNDNIGGDRFFYVSNVNLSGGNSASFGTDNGTYRGGVKINNYANDDITWETSRQMNLALELTFIKKLNIVAEVYKYHRYNILMGRSSIPSTMGLQSGINSNLGELDTKGIDLSMDYKHDFSKDLWASARGNLTFSTNKFVKYEEPNYKEPWRYRVGQPNDRYWGYVAERLFVDDKEAANSPMQVFGDGKRPKGGDIKYRDINGDGVIDGSDIVYLGYPTVPEIVYGFGFSAGYKGFDLSAFFQGQARVSLFINPGNVSPFRPSYGGNIQLLQCIADDHWTEANQNQYAFFPRLAATWNDYENNMQNSTWWMRNGSFMRLKSLEVGYSLPVKTAKRIGLSSCRFYFNGLNMLTISNFKLWDPEQGGNAFNYPIQKVYNLGINVNL